MNAKDLIERIQQHPLPWKFYDLSEGVEPSYPVYGDNASLILEFEDAQSLADAAPAMAAAILRYCVSVNIEALTATDAGERNIALADAYHALQALATSLPESLRP